MVILIVNILNFVLTFIYIADHKMQISYTKGPIESQTQTPNASNITYFTFNSSIRKFIRRFKTKNGIEELK